MTMRVAGVALLVVFTASVGRGQTGLAPIVNEARPIATEVRFTDGSVLKVRFKESVIDFVTKYGTLRVPIADIERVDFGIRIPEETAKNIDAAIAELGSPQFKVRETASANLLEYREKAYPALKRAATNADAEIASRAAEAIERLKARVPEELTALPDFDTLTVGESKVVGKFAPGLLDLPAETEQFGTVKVKLADIRIMGTKAVARIEVANAPDGPVNLLNHHNDIGKTLSFKVTGNVAANTIWGTDVYTTDSTLATVAVHAGLLKNGQTGVIKVSIVPSPNVYIASTRNGVTSMAFLQYPMAYRVHR